MRMCMVHRHTLLIKMNNINIRLKSDPVRSPHRALLALAHALTVKGAGVVGGETDSDGSFCKLIVYN